MSLSDARVAAYIGIIHVYVFYIARTENENKVTQRLCTYSLYLNYYTHREFPACGFVAEFILDPAHNFIYICTLYTCV